MAHALHVLPDSSGNAAQNMAFDFMMLQRYQPADAIRIRHYEWSRKAYTFGLSQRFSYIESEVSDPDVELCRRPTGGGIVNHLDDWTYALVIPTHHPLANAQPVEIYRVVHQALADAMGRQGVQATLNLTSPEDAAPGVCFNKPELYDIVLKDLPTKIAGAAQKRTKAGFLMQGSIWRPTVSHVEWNRFYNDFLLELSTVMEATIDYINAPSWDAKEMETLLTQFDSDAWNRRR